MFRLNLNFPLKLAVAVASAALITPITALATFDPAATSPSPLPPAAWGIDGCLSVHVKDPDEFAGYVDLLKASGIRWVRERSVWENEAIKARLALERDAGLHTSAFARTPGIGKPEREGNHLPEDLLAVYQAAYRQAKGAAGLVPVWELQNEADMGYIKDLPERYTAYARAMYLGLKDGARDAGHPTTVLMGAVGLPPGPWLERAAANGLYAYADAANIHFYGLAPELRGAIAAHRAFIREHVSLEGREPRSAGRLARHEHGWQGPRPWGSKRPEPLNRRADALPIWITECGINMVTQEDFNDSERRAAQHDFTVETALTAWREPDVAVFMPFVLVWKKDGHTMTMSPTEHFPAWTAYETLTRELRWPADRVMTRPPVDPSRLILQWLPDAPRRAVEGTRESGGGGGDEPARYDSPAKPVRTHKVAGTYRFTDGGSITGAVRLYNLGDTPRRGRLRWADGAAFTVRAAQQAETDLNLSPQPKLGDSRGSAGPTPNPPSLIPNDSSLLDGGRYVAVEVPPMGMVEVPVVFTPRAALGYFREEWRAEFMPTDGAGETWPVVFGLERLPVVMDFDIAPLPVAPAPSADWKGFAMAPEVVTSASGPWRGRNGVDIVNASESDVSGIFKVTTSQAHPMQPPSVAVRLQGLPEDGLLLVRADQPLVPWRRVRVDLFDDRGQRYTQWENGGMDYHGDGSEMWLSLRDFHIYFWGVTTADYRFDPKRIVELQLRFYLYDPEDEMSVTVELATPRDAARHARRAEGRVKGKGGAAAWPPWSKVSTSKVEGGAWPRA